MNGEAEQGGFWSGLAAGAFTGVMIILIIVLIAGDQLPGDAFGNWSIERSLSWAYRNLGFSLPIFGVILLLYFKSLFDLKTRIVSARRVDEVALALEPRELCRWLRTTPKRRATMATH